MKAFWLKHRHGLTAAAAIVLLYALLSVVGVGCPIKYLLGISCPGCGMTRACLSALRLDLRAAFYYHPLWVLLLPFAVAYALLWWRQKRLALRVLLGCAIALMLTVWVWRIFAHQGDVVVIAPQNGLIGRALRAVFDAISG